MSTTNEEIKNKGTEALIKMLDFTIQSMSDVVAFGKQQIPDVIHQLLVWNAVSSALHQVLMLAIIIVPCVVLYRAFKKKGIQNPNTLEYENRSFMYEKDGDFSLAMVPVTAISTILVVSALPGFFDNFDWLKIWLAPKVYLLEYAAELVKTKA